MITIMKTFLFICIALLFLPSYGFSPTTEGTKLNNPPSISICKADTPIQIDGLDQDWNSNDSIISINNLLSGNPSPVDLSGQFQVKWDNSYLYVFGHVTDDSFVNDSPSPWDDDSFEIYIDGGNEKGTSYDANDHQLIFRYNDLTVHDVSGNQTNPPGIDFKLTPSNGQYDIEVRISWAFIGIATPTTGTQIGLDIHLNDDDAAILNNPGVQIPSSDWTVYFDPNDPNSYNQNRSDCQLIVAGNRFNTGDATDSYQAGTGYGLSFDANSEIHSFPADGETLRFGARPAAGLCNSPKAFVNRFVWLNDGSYDEFQEQPNGVNLSTTFPGIDRTFYDGTKNQMGCIPTSVNDPKAVKVGPGADIVRLATTWRIEDWMLAADGKGCLHNLHEPGAGSPSPLSTYLGEGGFLTIVTRDTLGPFTPGTHFKRNDRVKIPITTADIGDWWSLVYEYRIDPTGSGFLRVWLDKGDGNFQQIVNATGIIGYRFAAGSSFNEKFYPVVMIFYSWHRYTYPGVINNWDPSYGDVRELHYAFAGFMVNGTRTAQDLMNHTHYITCGGGTTTGGGTRDASIAWSDTNNAAWSTPSVFGTITLGDCGNTWIEPDVCLWLEGAYDSNIGSFKRSYCKRICFRQDSLIMLRPGIIMGWKDLGGLLQIIRLEV